MYLPCSRSKRQAYRSAPTTNFIPAHTWQRRRMQVVMNCPRESDSPLTSGQFVTSISRYPPRTSVIGAREESTMQSPCRLALELAQPCARTAPHGASPASRDRSRHRSRLDRCCSLSIRKQHQTSTHDKFSRQLDRARRGHARREPARGTRSLRARNASKKCAIIRACGERGELFSSAPQDHSQRSRRDAMLALVEDDTRLSAAKS